MRWSTASNTNCARIKHRAAMGATEGVHHSQLPRTLTRNRRRRAGPQSIESYASRQKETIEQSDCGSATICLSFVAAIGDWSDTNCDRYIRRLHAGHAWGPAD